MAKQTLLLIDDEKLVTSYYKRALEDAGFDIVHKYGSDSTFELIEKQKPEIVGIILDIMMVPGDRYKDDPTTEGLRTGYFIFQDITKIYPDVPIIILTNVSNIEALSVEFGIRNLLIVRKIDYPPYEFVEFLKKEFEKFKNNTNTH